MPATAIVHINDSNQVACRWIAKLVPVQGIPAHKSPASLDFEEDADMEPLDGSDSDEESDTASNDGHDSPLARSIADLDDVALHPADEPDIGQGAPDDETNDVARLGPPTLPLTPPQQPATDTRQASPSPAVQASADEPADFAVEVADVITAASPETPPTADIHPQDSTPRSPPTAMLAFTDARSHLTVQTTTPYTAARSVMTQRTPGSALADLPSPPRTNLQGELQSSPPRSSIGTGGASGLAVGGTRPILMRRYAHSASRSWLLCRPSRLCRCQESQGRVLVRLWTLDDEHSCWAMWALWSSYPTCSWQLPFISFSYSLALQT